MLDFPPSISYNTSIGFDGNKYSFHVRLKRAFGWWKKAAAGWTNTSPSPGVNGFYSVVCRRCAVYSAFMRTRMLFDMC